MIEKLSYIGYSDSHKTVVTLLELELLLEKKL